MKHGYGAEASAVLVEVVAVEHQGLDPGELRVVAVQVTPACLDHPDLRVAEVADDRANEVGLGDEVGVEDRDELTLGDGEAGVERARLVADAIDAVMQVDAASMPRARSRVDLGSREALGVVGRVVEDLDLELVRRVIDARAGLDEARGDSRLVEERELDRDARELALDERRGLLRGAERLPVAIAEQHQVQPMQAIRAETEENSEVEDTEDGVEHPVRPA